MRRVVTEPHRAISIGSSQDVQEVHRVLRCRDSGSVVALRNQHHIPVPDRPGVINGPINGVDAEEATTLWRAMVTGRAADPEVVDLFVLYTGSPRCRRGDAVAKTTSCHPE